MNTVFCPVKNDQIDGNDCYIVCEVADNMLKKKFLPEGIQWNEEQKQKCLNCPYHADIS